MTELTTANCHITFAKTGRKTVGHHDRQPGRQTKKQQDIPIKGHGKRIDKYQLNGRAYGQ
jgi:hypothetical protein